MSSHDVISTFVCVAALVLLSSTCLANESGSPVTVMTYNIGGYAYIPLAQPEMAQIAQEIVTAGADIVGLTEVDIGTRNGTAPYMDMVSVISNELDALGYPMSHVQAQTVWYMGGYGVIVIFSRYPIVDSGDAMTLNCYLNAWRVVRATVEIAPGQQVHAFMTHYAFGLPPECPNQPADIMQYQTDIIFDYVSQYTGPKILMGDFNFGTTSTPYAQYIAAGWQDSCVAVGQSDCLTVGPSANVTPPLPRIDQIDFIFGSPDLPFTETYVPATTVSDHFPLVASFLSGATSDAIIGISPSMVTHEVIGCRDADDVNIVLSNVGTGTLDYTISESSTWLDVSPATGTITTETDVITLAFDTDTLEAGYYQTSLTVTDPAARNSPQIIDVELTVRVPGDFDGDGDVDQSDFGRFQSCLAGNGVIQDRPDCEYAHLDADTDVDGDDFALWFGCRTGANILGEAHCATGN